MTLLEYCLCCGELMPPPFLHLGTQPLANAYHDGSRSLPEYPLAVAQCQGCTHRQLTVAVDPTEMFQTYLYVSGTSKTLKDYFVWFADRVLSEAQAPARVLEIGCNDGSLLEVCVARGATARGVDPAENLGQVAREKGLDVVTGFWEEAFAREWEERYTIIVAMNVLGHVVNPLGFLCGCRKVLAPGGHLYVQVSQCDWLENGEFDCIYHEHLSYFTEASLRTLARRAGLEVAQAEKVPIHGRSWLFTLYDPLARFAQQARDIQQWTREQVAQAREEGCAVVGYGAAAKANTVLNAAEITLDYIVDDNPLKWGLLTPGRNIPICSPERLVQEERPLVLLLLAWNFEEEIVRRAKALRGDLPMRFLRYFPTPRAFDG